MTSDMIRGYNAQGIAVTVHKNLVGTVPGFTMTPTASLDHTASQSALNNANADMGGKVDVSMLPSSVQIWKPKFLKLSATKTTGKTKFYLNNSLELLQPAGYIDGDSVEFDIMGFGTAASFRKFIQTYAIVCDYYNYNTSAGEELQINTAPEFPIAMWDGFSQKLPIDISRDRRNTANLNNLETIFSSPVVIDLATGITLDITNLGDAKSVNLAFNIVAVIPYAKLDEFLQKNPTVIVAKK